MDDYYFLKLVFNILCKVGIHKYNVIDKIEYNQIGILKEDIHMVCERCNKKQWLDVHCLGLNPPKYQYVWWDMSPSPLSKWLNNLFYDIFR